LSIPDPLSPDPGAPSPASAVSPEGPAGPAWFRTVTVYANLSIDRREASLSVVFEFGVARETAAVVITEFSQSGLPGPTIQDPITLFTSDPALVQSAALPRVQLWQPNGAGRPTLYQARVSLIDLDRNLLDRRTVEFGVRQIDAAPGDGSPSDGLPCGLTVNGRRTWLQGWNWTTEETPGDEARYDRLMRLARDAQVNLLRVTGGLESETFYRLCDRHGILVWQDFPSPPAAEAADLNALWRHAEAVLPQRRNHPSLALWCGSSISDPRMLDEIRAAVETEDPQRLWLPSLTSSVHLAPAGDEAAVAPAPMTVEAAFGPLADAALARAGEWMEALGAQCAVEAGRRGQWECGGALPGVFCSAGDAAVDRALRPKPLYYAVKRAYRPFHVSASFSTFAWEGEPQFHADVWLHNAGPTRSLLNVVATVTDLEGRELYQENLAGEAPENGSENVGDLQWRFPPGFDRAFLLFLEVVDEEGETLARNAYSYSRAPAPAFTPFFQAPATRLEVSRTEQGVEIRNVGPAVALGVTVAAGEALVGDSDFPLAPGGTRRISVSDAAAAVRVTAWNAPELEAPAAG